MSGESTRQAPALGSVEPEQAPSSAAIAALKGTILAGANGPEGQLAADQLSALLLRLAQRSPTAQTRDLLRGLLELKELERFVDSSGISCRAAVVGAQLALGFPHALEVTPEDLELLREAAREAEARGNYAWTRLATIGSLFWNGFLAGMPILASQADGVGPNWPTVLPFALGAAHGLAATIASLVAERARSQPGRIGIGRWFRALGWAGLFGPVVAVLAAITWGGLDELPALVLLAAPTVIAGAVCALNSRALPSGDAPVSR